jgi:hypothetical protein
MDFLVYPLQNSWHELEIFVTNGRVSRASYPDAVGKPSCIVHREGRDVSFLSTALSGPQVSAFQY